ncbi:MAG: DUF11 domain-containing protein [Alphaproteobacteria bacterium]|nr:DUF11 domain-containing protein [Alphaproteobacteria bacterium]MBU0863406.1 DUF11 domain-containing protein [Alphaproteobacteria bacterium]MBU1823944.1 DUF11 domain-containing protein [Alphaproteobacteria bacterium]
MIGKSWTIMTLAAALAMGTQPAAAQGTGVLTNKVELEKSGPVIDGREGEKTYTTPDVVVPGDRIRLTLTFTNNAAAPAAGVNLTNPIPQALVFDGTNDTSGFALSVDGGKTFGALAALTIAVTGVAPRPAAAPDVTHVRWVWPDAVPAGQSRSVAFFGRVR